MLRLTLLALAVGLVAALPSSHFGRDREEGHVLRRSLLTRRQEPASAREAELPAGAKAGPKHSAHKPTPEEEKVATMVDKILTVGSALETVTSLATNVSEINKHIEKAYKFVSDAEAAQKEVAALVPDKGEIVSKTLQTSSESAQKLVQALKSLEGKTEDANAIKGQYEVLESTFTNILASADDLAIAALPKDSIILSGTVIPNESEGHSLANPTSPEAAAAATAEPAAAAAEPAAAAPPPAEQAAAPAA